MKRTQTMSGGIRKDLAAAERLVGRALMPFKQVTFSIEIFVHHMPPDDHPLISSKVTLWFGRTFQHSVKGSDDFAWLAGECRNQAGRMLEAIRAIANAAK